MLRAPHRTHLFRPQSGVFEALWLLTSELSRRLKVFYNEGEGAKAEGEGQQEPFALNYTENLPFQDQARP